MSHSLDTEIDRLREILWSPRDPQGRAFASLADAYRRRGDLPLARTMVSEGLERLPDFSGAHVVAGWIHRDMGSPVEADRSFRRVLELDPENAMALRALGELAEERGSHAEAAEFFRRLSNVDPEAHPSGRAATGEKDPGRAPDQEQAEATSVTVSAEGTDLAEEAEARTGAADGIDEAGGEPRRPAAVPVESLFPDAPLADEAAEGPDSRLDADAWLTGMDDGDGKDDELVSVADLAPDDGSFDFAVADLGDGTDSVVRAGLAEEADEAGAGWGLVDDAEDPEAETLDADGFGDEVAVPEPGAEAPASPDWSWSPALDEGPDSTGSGEAEAQEAAPPRDEATPPRESVDADDDGPSGPSPAEAVPITSLAPDPGSADPTGEGGRTASATPVHDPAPEPGSGIAEAPPSDDAAGEDEGDGLDDFQAWLERNSS